MALPLEDGLAVPLGLVEPLLDQVEQVSAASAESAVHQQDFHQAHQDMALDLGLPVTSPMAELDTSASPLLAHLETPAPVPFVDQESPASAWGVDSRTSVLGQEAAVPDQVVHLEPPAPAREVELEPLVLDWEEPPEAAALP